MTSVDRVTRILPGSPEWADLLAQIGADANGRDLNDENPFDQVAALKRAGFGTLGCLSISAARDSLCRSCSPR